MPHKKGGIDVESDKEPLPAVYNSLHFKSTHDPYTTTSASVYSTLHVNDVDSMLSGGLEKFFQKYQHISRKANIHLPTPEVRFDNLSYTVHAAEQTQSEKQGTVGSYITNMFPPYRARVYKEKKVLSNMSGIIKPGSMTLILANPGAGKSTLLKALAGTLEENKRCIIGGEISFSGLKSTDIDTRKLVGIVDQQDNHCATLTVRETFKFADMCLNGNPKYQPPHVRDIAELRTELIINLLGLTTCADTVVGDALLRGVSGGERKRVTVGEMLVGGQSVFLCDEISTGLDSAATYDIMTSLRTWCKTLGGTVVVALLQPTPEVVELFDDILMLNEGHMMYHGPRTSILPYFENLGFVCPPRTDPADFLIEVTSGRGKKFASESAKNTKLPIFPDEFSSIFFNSDIYNSTSSEINKGFVVPDQLESRQDFQMMKSVTSIARSKESSPFAMGFMESTLLLLNRQTTIWLRDRPLLWGKLIEALIVGLLLGAMYYEADTSLYLRMIFFTCAVFQRQAWQQITIAYHLRSVFYKQRARNFFRTSSYTIAESVVQVPVNLAVALTMGMFFYYMSGMDRNAGSFFVFLLVVVAFQHAIGAYMTMLSSLSPTITIGQTLAAFSVCFFLLFSGNIILTGIIPSYWKWMHWFDPLAWPLRSIVLSEFHSAKYDTKRAFADSQLLNFQMIQFDEIYIWIGVIVLILYYFLFTTLNGLALHYIRYVKRLGVSGGAKIGDDDDETGSDEVYVEVTTPGGTTTKQKAAKGGLQFIPAYLCIQNLEYYVTLPSKEEKQLLRGITAYFPPGKMTALMGATGAGKTTLMDVIAGRKTGGRTLGEIIINGEPKNPANFSRITAYCEQMDIHSERATIKEALWFSANLRLPETVTLEEKTSLVNETLDLLELTNIMEEQVADLSVEQKKRVTIGVEVVSNPSILFLDEPTSGLDARSAQIVMRGVQSIARTGRTVVCTIHQPSIQIFELFDSLLLLQTGGYTAYFGELGRDSCKMLEYFASIPGTVEIRPQYNPATYMLEVIGAGIGRDTKDYSVEYSKSELSKWNAEETDRRSQLSEEFVAFSTCNYTPMATGFKNQLKEMVKKSAQTYWRTPQYNFVRLASFPWFAIVFGTTFWQLSRDTEARINSHVGLIYNSMDFIGIFHLMTVIDITCSERAVFYRERMSNYYGALPYSLSLFTAELPYLVVAIFIFVLLEYFMVGWNASYFFFFLIVFFLYTSVCTFVGQWMCALCPNTKVANVAVGAISCVFNLFSGFLLPYPLMKDWFKRVIYITPSSYSLRALVASQMGICVNGEGNGCEFVQKVLVDGKPASVAQYVEKNFDIQADNRYYYALVLFLMWFVLQFFIFVTFKYVSHLKR